VPQEPPATDPEPSRIRPEPTDGCQQCGRSPAANVTFLGDDGSPAQARDVPLSGPFCRDCGIATFRTATAWSLTNGWLSRYSLITVPLAVIANLGARRRVAILRTPQSPTPDRAPLPPGRTLWLRWQILGAALPFVLVGGMIGFVVRAIDARDTAAKAKAGRCVEMTEDAPSIFLRTRIVDCDRPHNGVITQLVRAVADCPPGTMSATSAGYVYCITPQ
jgi:hypothetical protein